MRFSFLFMFVLSVVLPIIIILRIIIVIINNYGVWCWCMSSVCHHSLVLVFCTFSVGMLSHGFFVFPGLVWCVRLSSRSLYLSILFVVALLVAQVCWVMYWSWEVKVTECLRWFDFVISVISSLLRFVALLFPSIALSFRFLVLVSNLHHVFVPFLISCRVLDQSLSFQMFIPVLDVYCHVAVSSLIHAFHVFSWMCCWG